MMNDIRTTLTNEDGSLVPVIVRYEVEGYKQVSIVSIHADMPGELGPDISDCFDADEAKYCVCLQVEWNQPKNQHYRGDN